jgi:hypothetical protein
MAKSPIPIMSICRLCGKDGELVDSHIIPKAFHRDLKGGSDGAPIIIGTNPLAFPKRNPGGIYEEDLLCRPCEERFGPWDDYGAQCLIQNYARDVQPLNFNGEELAYKFPTWDEERLRMFALSLLWRAAVTTNETFSAVTLGPHLARLTERILAGDPGSADDFSVMLVRWSTMATHESLRKIQMSPYPVKLLGINEVKMFMGGFVIHVKVDKRPYPKPFDELILRPGRPVYMCKRELERSQDIQAMRPAFERLAASRGRK